MMKCSGNDAGHIACCIMPLLSMLFWAATFVSLIFAVISLGGFWWEVSSVEWFDIAQALGILTIGLKLGLLIRLRQQEER
ncbi:MAG: hypothetical protein HYW88_01935 [Candidatus Sungbacteria bacterium]|nr:hypothetical protein [Candidatus Sungbacteria bacterium]